METQDSYSDNDRDVDLPFKAPKDFTDQNGGDHARYGKLWSTTRF